MNKSKQSNVELLRIIAAFAIVLYHIFSQSGAYGPENSTHFLFAVCLGGGGRVSCTVFVMIGAYFLVDVPFRLQRIVRLWLKVLIVAVIVNCVVFLVNPIPATEQGLLYQFFPILGRPYWFISDYIILLVVSPFLNLILRCDSLRKYLKWALRGAVVTIVVLSFFPQEFKHSIFFNDFICFCFFYIFTGYIKLHSTLHIWTHKYLFLCVAIVSYSLICYLSITLDKMKDTWSYAWEIRFFYMSTYQSVFSFICAFSTVQFFLKLELGSKKLINCIGRHTLGIYVIHQVPILYINNGWIWREVFHLNYYFNTPKFYYISIGILLIVVTISVCMDAVCDMIINRIIKLKYIDEMCMRVNQLVEQTKKMV